MIDDRSPARQETPEARDKAARAEAAAWYAKMRGDRISAREVDAFYTWRSDSLNDAAYSRIEALTTGVSAAADNPRLKTIARAAVERRRTWPERFAPPRGRKLAAAAGFGAILAVAVVGMVLWGPLGERTYSTDVGERRAVTLADGSSVELNTDSRVRVRLARDRRDLVLERGQAMFAVAHDAARPFIVKAGDTSVRAIGTRFEVYKASDAVRVILAEGRVEVRGGGGSATQVTLTAGQEVELGRRGPARPRAVDLASALDWTSGRLTFRDTRLDAAVAEVNRYSKRRVVLAADAPADRRVNAVFNAGDTDAFVAGMAAALDLKATERPNGDIELGAQIGEHRPAG